MRRDLLIGFAGGTALSAAISVSASMLIPAKPPSRPVLVVYDKGVPLAEIENDPSTELTAGQLMHNCGTKDFAVHKVTATDSSNYVEAALVDENLPGIACAIKKASAEGFEFSLAQKNPK